MLRQLVQTWWLLQARGILAVAFGAFLFFLSGMFAGPLGTAIGLVGVMLIFVLYLLLSAVLGMLAAFKSFERRRRFWAALGYGAGLFVLAIWLFYSNDFTFMWIVWLTVVNAFASGILELVLSRALRRHLDALPLAIAGGMSVLASIAMVIARDAQVSRLVLSVGVYAVFYGTVLIVFSLRLHGAGRHLHLAQTR